MKKGFTLIELMIVITVIGLLSAIALPRFTDMSREAKVAQVQENLANLRTSVGMYYASEERYPVYGTGEDISPDGELSESFRKFYSRSEMPTTPSSGSILESNRVEDVRDDEGGWIYLQEGGEVYANLPDGFYTGDEDEIWNEEGGEEEGPVLPPVQEEVKEISGDKLGVFDTHPDDYLNIGYGDDGLRHNKEKGVLEVSPFRGGVLKFDKKVSEISIVANYYVREKGWTITPNSDGSYTYEMKIDPPSESIDTPDPRFGELWSGENYISKVTYK